MSAGPNPLPPEDAEQGQKIAFSRRTLAFFGLGVLTTVAFLYAFADVGEAITIIASANPLIYFLSFLSVTLGTLAYTLAWHVLLRDAGARLSVLREWSIIWVSVFLNILVPTGSVSGEIARIYLTTKDSDRKRLGEITATVLAHRIVTMMPFLLGSVTGFIYLALAYKASGVILGLASLVVFLLLAAFMGVYYLILSPKRIERFVVGILQLLRRLSIRRLNRRLDAAQTSLDENLKAFSHGIGALRQKPKSLALSSAFSALFWVLDAFVAYFAFQAINFPVPLETLVFVYTIGITVQMVPLGVPGMVGVVEVTMITLYSVTGIPLKVGAAATILIRIVMLWFELLVGGAVTYLILLRHNGHEG